MVDKGLDEAVKELRRVRRDRVPAVLAAVRAAGATDARKRLAGMAEMLLESKDSGRLFEELEGELFRQSLARSEWNISAAARTLGIDRKALERGMKRHAIKTPKPRAK